MNIKAAKTDTLSSGVNTKRFASTSAVDMRPPLFALSRLTGVIGAEISGVDLGATLDDATITALSEALVEHKVLFFRDQSMTMEQHVAFARRFGPLEVHPFTEGSRSGTKNEGPSEAVLVFESTAERHTAAQQWHSDVTWRVDPSLASILLCRIAPSYGGDTVLGGYDRCL